MSKKATGNPRRDESLSRAQIIEASIALLDANGEPGLTFRTLAERLATGAGAIYWHIDNKSDLLLASCDAIISHVTKATAPTKTPEAGIRSVALAIFDAIDAHPWVGSALTRAAGKLPMVRILERLAEQVCALGVPEGDRWSAVSALLSYILGVAGQNAANRQLAQALQLDRSTFLEDVSTVWSQLDVNAFPFTRELAKALPGHDDRADFIAGIDFILCGINANGHLR